MLINGLNGVLFNYLMKYFHTVVLRPSIWIFCDCQV